jgi:RecA/RadA recombinase
LKPHIVEDALYDSAQREKEHAVACQPQTRAKILDDIRSWADNRLSAHVCWLSGPAGTGKTTVAHTIAAEYDQRGQLAATFFFWRKTKDRDDIKRLVPTLAYQIAKKIPSARKAMEKTLNLNDASPPRDPLSLSLENQLSTFLIASANPPVPNLVVIDGLDECASQDGICKLIELICKKSPFRWLLTSRPEPRIEASFLCHGHTNALSLSLTDSRDDIRKYLVEKLGDLWRKKDWLNREQLSWPSKLDLEKLVEQSEGLFIYAATAVRHIGGKGAPEKRLEDVLKLHKGLDNLYIQVVEEASEWDYFSIVMGSLLYLRRPLSVHDLFTILHPLYRHLTMPVIRSALDGCHSILAITNDDNTAIESYHASLRDFLTDHSRSQTLFRPPATSHGRLAFACLSAITRAFNDGQPAPKYALISWYHHSCLFLSAGEGGEELEELRDEARELVKKIDLKWVRVWMGEALCWAGLPYLRRAKFSTKVRK